MIAVAFVGLFAGILGHYLGLYGAIAKVVGKILSCGLCTTFWLTLTLLLVTGNNIVISLGLAMTCAYVSLWSIPLVERMDSLWQRSRKKPKRKKERMKE